MKPLRATQIAIRVRDICNHWPQYSYMRNVPLHSLRIDVLTTDVLYVRSHTDKSRDHIEALMDDLELTRDK